MGGVVDCLLTALSLLAFLGLRYPTRMLPVLIFETVWKIIWLSVVGIPAVLEGNVDSETHRAKPQVTVPDIVVRSSHSSSPFHHFPTFPHGLVGQLDDDRKP